MFPPMNRWAIFERPCGTPEPGEALGLGMNWEVAECIHDRDAGVVRLRVRETPHLRQSERSPCVGGPVVACDHTGESVWRHLNVFERRREVRCRLPRGRCQRTGKVYRVLPPWEGLSEHFTQAFEALASLLMREMPVAAAARLWRMLHARGTQRQPLGVVEEHGQPDRQAAGGPRASGEPPPAHG